jgi:tetratricopeptide (TPR) repeat protein
VYREAFERYQRAIELGGKCYNLACLYARRSEKEQALEYLERSLANKEFTAAYVKQDTLWKAYLADNDFIALLRRVE